MLYRVTIADKKTGREFHQLILAGSTEEAQASAARLYPRDLVGAAAPVTDATALLVEIYTQALTANVALERIRRSTIVDFPVGAIFVGVLAGLIAFAILAAIAGTTLAGVFHR